ncbi:AAA domain-containing protein [Spinellus fusiger]|nr:AAA domain-containing protein [Spinellus fusiger]
METTVLVLVGLPGSGKSTFAEALVNKRPNWRRVNQDEMKTRKQCEKFTREFLKKQYSVVVDRCNFDASQRATWIAIAEKFGVNVDCIVFTTTSNECIQRVLHRVNHPTGVQGKQGVFVYQRLQADYSPPTQENPEGFRHLVYVSPSLQPQYTGECVDEIMNLLETTRLSVAPRI